MSDSRDPLDSTPYTYSVNVTQNKYQVLGFLENADSLTFSSPYGGGILAQIQNQILPDVSWIPAFAGMTNIVVPTVYANPASYSGRTIVTKGNALGILLSSGTLIPLQTNYNASSFTGVDVVNTNSGYIAQLSNTDSISGTGLFIAQIANRLTTLKDI
jgi:hypothetical protein